MESVAVLFRNDSDEEFVSSWNSVKYTFLPHQERYVEKFLADHFAKHWATKEMNKRKMITTNMVERQVFLDRCLPVEEVITKEEAFEIEAKEAVKEKKVKASKKVVVEEEFEGLKKK